MPLRDFAATDALGDAALRALLAGGAPPERVWAAWRIALRRGSAMPEIVGAARGEPSPGVRRALLNVLAGHGEVDVLVALARRDPADEVRASAIALVTRFAQQGAIPIDVVTDAYAADPAVRVAALGAIVAGAGRDLRGLVARALVDDARPADERLEAFEACFRIDAASAALRWLANTRGPIAEAAWVRLEVVVRDEEALAPAVRGQLARLRAHRERMRPKPKPVQTK